MSDRILDLEQAEDIAADCRLDKLGADVLLLLREAAETYDAAMEDWETRRPGRRLEDNWDPDEPVHDYGGMAGAGLRGWREFYRRFWSPGQGGGKHPSKGSGLTLAPLYPVYELVEQFWARHVGEKFVPGFDWNLTGVDDDYKKYNYERLNPEGKLFQRIAMVLDDRHTYRNCTSVHKSIRSARRSG